MTPQKTIEAIVEISSFDGEPPWALSSIIDQSFIRLFSGTTEEEIGSVMLTACLYNQIEICPSAIDNLNALVAKERIILPGGLQFSENLQVKIYSSCCSGLENWREWLGVPNGNLFVWAGHDPTPEVEFIGDGIRIWQDEKADGVEFIDLGINEMRHLLEKVESDLKGFVIRLSKWADFVAPSLRRQIVECFINNMNI